MTTRQLLLKFADALRNDKSLLESGTLTKEDVVIRYRDFENGKPIKFSAISRFVRDLGLTMSLKDVPKPCSLSATDVGIMTSSIQRLCERVLVLEKDLQLCRDAILWIYDSFGGPTIPPKKE